MAESDEAVRTPVPGRSHRVMTSSTVASSALNRIRKIRHDSGSASITSSLNVPQQAASSAEFTTPPQQTVVSFVVEENKKLDKFLSEHTRERWKVLNICLQCYPLMIIVISVVLTISSTFTKVANGKTAFSIFNSIVYAISIVIMIFIIVDQRVTTRRRKRREDEKVKAEQEKFAMSVVPQTGDVILVDNVEETQENNSLYVNSLNATKKETVRDTISNKSTGPGSRIQPVSSEVPYLRHEAEYDEQAAADNTSVTNMAEESCSSKWDRSTDEEDEMNEHLSLMQTTASLAHEGTTIFVRFGAAVFASAFVVFIGLKVADTLNCGGGPPMFVDSGMKGAFVVLQTYILFKFRVIMIDAKKRKQLYQIGLVHLICANLITWLTIVTFEIREFNGHYDEEKKVEAGNVTCISLLHPRLPVLLPFLSEYSLLSVAIFAAILASWRAELSSSMINSLRRIIRRRHDSANNKPLRNQIALRRNSDYNVSSAIKPAEKPRGSVTSVGYSEAAPASDLRQQSTVTSHMPQQGAVVAFEKSHTGLYLSFLYLAGIIFAIMYTVIAGNAGKTRDQRVSYTAAAGVQNLLTLLALAIAFYSTRAFYHRNTASNSKNSPDTFFLWLSLMGSLLLDAFLIASYATCLYHATTNTSPTHTLTADLQPNSSLRNQINQPLYDSCASTTDSGYAASRVAVAVTSIAVALAQFVFVTDRLSRVCDDQRRMRGRNAVVFLIVANIAAWLHRTALVKWVETQDTPHAAVFGEAQWSVLLNVTLPLTLFYHFHSCVCLADIWTWVYSPKHGEI